jgi:1-acyl-sn-glycerol-3-phosphate acyltransferase
MLLTRLGVPKLWGEDPDRLWHLARPPAARITMALAPGSRGYGLDRLPAEGGAVVAANHFSALDPSFLGSFSRRTLYLMAKAELIAMPVIGEVLSWTGAFPVRRGEGDRDALRHSQTLVREGHVLGVFVEGTRQRAGELGPVNPGAAMIAVQEGVPLVPCALDSFGWSLKNRRACCIVWGEPMSLDGIPRTGRGYKQASQLIGEELKRLWELAGEAVSAGFPPVLADGARRSRWIRPAAIAREPYYERRENGLQLRID